MRCLLKLFIQLSVSLLLFWPLAAFSWDASGHRVIAAIAYSQLLPSTKANVDRLTNTLDPGYPPFARFLYLAVLPDKWRAQGWAQDNISHFIDTPWSNDATPTRPIKSPTIITTLAHNQLLLNVPHTSPMQQAIALAYVIHLVGDAHQPLHVSNRFSKQFPQGDQGGNLFPIRATNANNLHAYWDQGTRLLIATSQHYPLSNKKVKSLAMALQNHTANTLSAAEIHDLNLSNWCAESLILAQTVVYQLPPDTKPSPLYITKATAVIDRQLTLAGERLAVLLNNVFAK